jgi:parallel beta-helix repeat protein
MVVALIASFAPKADAVVLPCQFSVTSSVKLTADVGSEASPCLFYGLIAAKSNITIDLNGYTIWGQIGDDDPINPEVGVWVPNGASRVVIKNGTMRGWQNSVRIESNNNTVNGVVSAGSEFSSIVLLGNDNTVSNNHVSQGNNGFAATGDRNRFSRNTATLNAKSGFSLAGDRLKIVSNEASGNGEDGFTLTLTRGSVSKNKVSNNGIWGFYIDAQRSTVKGNRAAGSASSGLLVNGVFNKILGNESSGSSFNGIQAECDDCTIFGNSVSGNQERGIIVIGDRTTVQKNVAVDNFVGVTVGGNDIVVADNVAKGNGAYGVLLTAKSLMGGIPSIGVKVLRNRGIGNGFDPGPYGPVTTGVDATDLMVQQLSGSKNIGRGNSDPQECLPTFICSYPN